jgi:hypothetical protein
MTREKKRNNKDRTDKTTLLIDHRIFLNMLLQITSLEAKQILVGYIRPVASGSLQPS